MKQHIAGTLATPDAAQDVSDQAHAAWRQHMDRHCRALLEEFLANPQFFSLERLIEATAGLLRSVEARRMSKEK